MSSWKSRRWKTRSDANPLIVALSRNMNIRCSIVEEKRYLDCSSISRTDQTVTHHLLPFRATFHERLTFALLERPVLDLCDIRNLARVPPFDLSTSFGTTHPCGWSA